MKRTERFGLVFSPLEKAAVTRLAEQEGGLSQAALIRMLIRRAAHKRGLWPIRQDAQGEERRNPSKNANCADAKRL